MEETIEFLINDLVENKINLVLFKRNLTQQGSPARHLGIIETIWNAAIAKKLACLNQQLHEVCHPFPHL